MDENEEIKDAIIHLLRAIDIAPVMAKELLDKALQEYTEEFE